MEKVPGISKAITISDHLLSSIEDEILNGLWTDGAHHKQESLENILKLLFGNKRSQELFSDSDTTWDRPYE